MVVSLKPEIEKLVQDKVRAGVYKSADDLVNAALEQFIGDDDFAPGELDRLLAAGEADAKAGRFVDGEEAFRKLGVPNSSSRNGP